MQSRLLQLSFALFLLVQSFNAHSIYGEATIVSAVSTTPPVLLAPTSTVLLLNSYHPQYRWTDQLSKGVKNTLSSSISAENLHVEYMDSRRFVDDKQYGEHLKTLLKYKYQQFKPDLIITSDDHAYNFMLEHGESLFPGKPVVFSGVNVFDQASLERKENFTGILEGMEISGNLELIQKVQPEVNHIVMLGDTTGLGLRMVQKARQIQLDWQNNPEKQNISLKILDRFSLKELNHIAANAPADTAFLMLAIHKDKFGKYFSFDSELPVLSEYSNVPIYGMWGGLMIGNGILGGMLNDPYLHGQKAANMALAILSGVPISQVKLQPKAQYLPVFDYNQLQRFSINPDTLPDNSLIHNQPRTTYQAYGSLINGVLGLVVFLFAVIYILTINVNRRKLVQHQLSKLNRELEYKVYQRTRDLEERNKELENVSSRMEELAHTDALTGLGNRRAGALDVESYVHRANISHENFSLAILDIDFFKRVNDNFGHQIGDDVLFTVSQTIKHALRPSDRVYRWGGEEFLMVLPNTGEEFASAVCQRVRKNVQAVEHAKVGQITVSIGVGTLHQIDNFESLLKRCDDMLYQAKENGRDQVVAAR